MAKYIATHIVDLSRSADGNEVTFSIATKYVGEMIFTMPASGLDDLRAALDRLTGAVKPVLENDGALTKVGAPPNAGAPAIGSSVSGGARKTKGVLHTPKKWVLGAETTKHKIVALIFDPQSDREAGFALSPQAAKDLAAGLVKSAESVSNHQPPKPN